MADITVTVIGVDVASVNMGIIHNITVIVLGVQSIQSCIYTQCVMHIL